MEEFIIEGGVPLKGEITPAGNKNAALPLLAACILTDEPVILHRVPQIRDVLDMRELVTSLGVSVEDLGGSTWKITAATVKPGELDPDLCRRIRASILLAGPVLARAGSLHLPPPGGDVIGRRRLDTHMLALQQMGARVDYDRVFKLTASGLKGADILLDEASVTATENIVMAAATAAGTTVIRNAASEPHVQDVCRCLMALGARIQGLGSNTLRVDGVPRLHGGEFTIGADYLEVVSFAGAAAITGGEIRIRDAGVTDLDMIAQAFRRLGLEWQLEGQDMIVGPDQPLAIVPDLDGAIPEIKTNVWPAYPTDLISIGITVATQASGSVLFHDWMYSGRMYFTDKLVSMGARIILCDPYRCVVQGRTRLVGEKLESPDIRAGMALLLAALAAEGPSTIRNINQIDRGYENVEGKLRALGARIERMVE
ncbi:MAG: UDP-N-acetylglucosamine 1-carboxyvinyltransferase [Anaerolineales bacterium]